MKKPIRKIGIVIILIFVAAFVRGFKVAINSGGAGGGAISPNKRFLAVGESFEGEKFWGGKYTFYEFTIESTNHHLISHCKLDNPPPPLADWREDGDRLIQWETNSSSVTYNFNGGHLTLSVNP